MEKVNNPYYGLQTKHEPCECKDADSCKKVAYQNAEISVPVELKPDAKIGRIETECCGEPTIECKSHKEDKEENVCMLVITQKVCIKIPIQYDLTACIGKEKIDCGCDEGCRD